MKYIKSIGQPYAVYREVNLLHIAHGTKNLKIQASGSVVALGNFDGFHIGHQHVIGEAGRLARTLGLPLIVVVTDPHPNHFFRPDLPAFRLTNETTRAQLLAAFGVDQLLILPFDRALAATSAQDFVLDILLGALNARHIVVGYDYRFGSKRGGGTDVLAYMGLMEDFGLTVVAPAKSNETDNAVIYSSTAIRLALQAGEIEQANMLLGHPWRIQGTVQKGDARGRTIGFPTANIALGDLIEPKLGVYAVRVHIGDDPTPYGGVANIGRRPTFDKRDVLLEVFLFDFNGDLYGKTLNIDLVHMIRPEQKFDGLEALKVQIAEDSKAARSILDQQPPAIRPTLDAYLEKYPDFPDDTSL